jgi:hypothetical protein
VGHWRLQRSTLPAESQHLGLERRGRVVSGPVRLAAPRARHWGNSIVFLSAKRRSINLFHGEQKLEGGSQLIQNAQAPKTQVWRGRTAARTTSRHAARDAVLAPACRRNRKGDEGHASQSNRQTHIGRALNEEPQSELLR